MLEDGRVWLLVADASADAHDLEVTRQIQRLQQLRRVPAPVADHTEAQSGRLHGIERRDDVGEDMEGRAPTEGSVDVPEEGLRQVRVAEAVEDELVELGESLEGGGLGGFEWAFMGPFRPGRPEGLLEGLLSRLDVIAIEDGRIDVKPGRVGLGHGVADVDEHDARPDAWFHEHRV